MLFKFRLSMQCAIWMSLSSALLACAASPPPPTPAMIGAGLVQPPQGYVQFCLSSPDDCAPSSETPRVRLTSARWLALAQENAAINRRIYPQTDSYGLDDWRYPEFFGDCEDYALAKQKALAEKGWPRAALRLAAVTSHRTGRHAVLVVATDQGDFVLDNLTNRIRPWSATPYRWISRQTANHPLIWEKIHAPAAVSPTVRTAQATPIQSNLADTPARLTRATPQSEQGTRPADMAGSP